MGKGFFKVPKAVNEPVKSYAKGTPEREAVLKAYKELWNNSVDVPLYIGADQIRTGKTKNMIAPHDHQHVVGTYHLAEKQHVEKAIATALEARKKWAALPWQERASIFLKAAELIAGPYRAKINAATMIAQSKTIHQAEIDSACELIDFLRFNVEFMANIYNDQPISSEGIWNRVEYRPLEGFVYAVTPFNFTAISGNLPASAALMGNVVIWKPSNAQVFSANVIMEIFKEAGLPDGVINFINGDAAMITETLLASPYFAGIHFTGSTGVFQDIWKKIGNNIHNYKTYPKIVGETGGKDFIVAHPSAISKQVATAITRGAFEFQGQKCSAASRVYLPKSKADEILNFVKEDVQSFKMGSPEDMENFITAVIHESSFDKLVKYIDQAKKDKDAEVFVGGNYDKSKGYFIEPTVIVTTNPKYTTMETELFGPVVTVYVYDDNKWEETLKLVDETSEYALTGAVFSQDRYALNQAIKALEDAAGNFYINDKPTGAVVGQQPFGGARASGTNDKAGSAQNLLRWVSPRLIKETFVPPVDYRYPFLG
ncbi:MULTISPECIES: L-glutamate gamma-semialdehyde dehydrogenase [Capnocytophaga]|uniref:L-glutamate gamma-semialdehyde dehydrogenase n=3 Tax=Capnocytophaga TaxID=1016 RepID=A0A0B7H3I3_9FLAO|nr:MULTISPECIES: L-glutamate gamma-semialdehyde dehydrogenase [Capnocytophaga]ATA92609.1 1-pyrroline-5-carboxylate dehydrogenase [Capnocytophaga canimorsus]CEN32507.1 Delta-1-pyrroline-5-carboxylate dehydrogenase, mitochondrial [Capnocytophaga cynodegmi]CEN33699.1 Delta-1-pyrroline-5-carboxylate dehydrogenase, mitochondrial [Capnocytophaga cynodegmi]VEJ20199.1 1-pyrroline-5-carboxylate dehydrogenase [Capnocytophaga canimorsus]GJQ07570.1 1-pyrroline-5-carboxylate dehydrogenase [Capnocytophaga c